MDESDHLNVWILADVKHRLLVADSNAELVRMASEMRQLEMNLGLNPKARQVMKVDVDRGESAERRTRERRNRSAVSAAKGKTTDPRDALSA